MDFFKNMRDIIHSFSHETRTALAMGIMGVAMLSFFYVWNIVTPLRMVSLAPTPAATDEPESLGPTQITMAGPYEPMPASGVSKAVPADTSDGILSPVQGIAGTFAGLGELFSPSDADGGGQTFTSMARSLADLGGSVARGAMRLFWLVADMIGSVVDALQKISTNFVAPNY